MSERPHYRLAAWQEAIQLIKIIYQISYQFPSHELYGLTSQMRRAAISIASNIAEGAARKSRKEFAQFLVIASGSISELETQLIIARELGYLVADHSVFERLERVSKLITGLRRSIGNG